MKRSSCRSALDQCRRALPAYSKLTVKFQPSPRNCDVISRFQRSGLLIGQQPVNFDVPERCRKIELSQLFVLCCGGGFPELIFLRGMCSKISESGKNAPLSVLAIPSKSKEYGYSGVEYSALFIRNNGTLVHAKEGDFYVLPDIGRNHALVFNNKAANHTGLPLFCYLVSPRAK